MCRKQHTVSVLLLRLVAILLRQYSRDTEYQYPREHQPADIVFVNLVLNLHVTTPP